ncbi:hypothetical protein PCCS19_33060 [Paenibacillus sp. CCS19]|uniref:hypothetical protein n=1 Tax=Paenibacillus sp. CCS19 TaxID=3158387 RepID=UPI00255FB7F6|nr:hypothetical protein [Paenibacillus cellulosilyticus]GMK40251.1 hypothetical protein PCCS19_33060 [Paenibacillus cellulosilyticus]
MSIEKSIQRIQRINWNSENKPGKLHSILVGEYLRRLACFYKPYCINQSPLGSLLDVIKVDERVHIEIEGLAEETLLDIENPIHYKICKNYIELSYLMENKYTEAQQAQELYEPIIKFFERGGKLRFDSDRSLSCGSAAFVLNDWIEFHSNREKADISNDNLDRLEKENFM